MEMADNTAQYLADHERAVRLADFGDGIDAIAAGPNGFLYALSYAGAPDGKIVRFAPPFAGPGLRNGIPTVPESNIAIEHGHTIRALTLTNSHLLVRGIAGGANRVRAFAHDGKPKGTLALPALSSVGEIVPLSNGDVVYSVLSYFHPSRLLRWDGAGKSKRPISQKPQPTRSMMQKR